jgi:uncharacterized protein
VDIRVNGMPLPPEAAAQLQSVTTQDDIQALSMFTLQLNNWDTDALRFTWSDSPLFAVGNEVEIYLGFLGDLHLVMTGDIISLEPVFSGQQAPVLTVRGYDRSHRLARSPRSRTFLNMKDSDIAGKIAQEAGLRPQIEVSTVIHEYLLQANQSDWDFLVHRATLIGYEVFVREQALYFRPVNTAGPAIDSLSLGEDIAEFAPRLSALNQASSVSVGFWDVMQKQMATATTQLSPGLATGPGIAQKAFGAAVVPSLGQPARSLSEASMIAQSQFDAMALTFVEGTGTAFGRPELLAGSVVDISGAGQTFSGHYYVTSVSHDVTPGSGFLTSFTVRRNAV